jgi:multidrug efflux pump subunit AcrA (membrane-fusion protein)
VKTGPRNDTEVVILSGLQEGDIIRASAAEEPASGEQP